MAGVGCPSWAKACFLFCSLQSDAFGQVWSGPPSLLTPSTHSSVIPTDGEPIGPYKACPHYLCVIVPYLLLVSLPLGMLWIYKLAFIHPYLKRGLPSVHAELGTILCFISKRSVWQWAPECRQITSPLLLPVFGKPPFRVAWQASASHPVSPWHFWIASFLKDPCQQQCNP